jgi:hypothetical protein
MSSNQPFLGERVAALEVENESLDRRVSGHDKTIVAMDTKITELIYQVRQIRLALYVIAGALVANTPVSSALVSILKAAL